MISEYDTNNEFGEYWSEIPNVDQDLSQPILPNIVTTDLLPLLCPIELVSFGTSKNSNLYTFPLNTDVICPEHRLPLIFLKRTYLMIILSYKSHVEGSDIKVDIEGYGNFLQSDMYVSKGTIQVAVRDARPNSRGRVTSFHGCSIKIMYQGIKIYEIGPLCNRIGP